MATQAANSFIDSIVARLLALCLALFFSIMLVYNYKDDFRTLVSADDPANLPANSSDVSSEAVSNPALEACLQQRIGDVDRMKEDGILSDAQYASFRARAEELCVQQNQG